MGKIPRDPRGVMRAWTACIPWMAVISWQERAWEAPGQTLHRASRWRLDRHSYYFIFLKLQCEAWHSGSGREVFSWQPAIVSSYGRETSVPRRTATGCKRFIFSSAAITPAGDLILWLWNSPCVLEWVCVYVCASPCIRVSNSYPLACDYQWATFFMAWYEGNCIRVTWLFGQGSEHSKSCNNLVYA